VAVVHAEAHEQEQVLVPRGAVQVPRKVDCIEAALAMLRQQPAAAERALRRDPAPKF